jgi:hypothetical protein
MLYIYPEDCWVTGWVTDRQPIKKHKCPNDDRDMVCMSLAKGKDQTFELWLCSECHYTMHLEQLNPGKRRKRVKGKNNGYYC